MGNIYAIIVCGGSGSRVKKDIPKQLLKLKGETLVRHVVKRYVSWGMVKSIVVVANEKYLKEIKKEIKDLLKPDDLVVPGGATRHQSCLKGVSALKYSTDDIIVFHDCARPFFLNSELDNVCNSAIQYGAATLAEEITETVVRTFEQKVESILDRNGIHLVKTPQALHTSLLDLLLKQSYEEEPTDLCTWTMNVGVKPFIVPSNPYNIKITREGDLETAERYYDLFKELEKI
ncbi:MAG: 2-C-methyl-D-erythritol 4-phosphate cytidylyltransferase [Leptospiraceae bacterium]|nr:2-C-methyl-D-erythritol 4-phosphate cytidylyltransferase [Leptospiraceae bacterium]